MISHLDGSTGDLTVIVPVYNERSALPRLIACIERQTRRPEAVIVADGGSTDGTREWLTESMEDRPWLRLVDNPERIIPVALNRALAEVSTEYVARMDAHGDYAPDYLERLVRTLETHPEAVGTGGAMETVGDSTWGRATATVLRRPVGMGGARHRVGGEAGPIDHVFTGTYRRWAIAAVGGFDPTFLANEDYEMDYRLRAAGGVILLDPTAHCTWHTRTRPTGLVTQMYRYGFFKARCLRRHPRSFRWRQGIPPGLVVGLTVLGVVRPQLAAVVAALYLGIAFLAGALGAMRDGTSMWRAGLAVPAIHLSWGIGVIVGLIVHRGVRGHGEPSGVSAAHTSPTTAGASLHDPGEVA